MLKNFLIETITIPLAEYKALKALVAELQQQVLLLQEQIQLLKNGRNSNTSSTPPSQDIGRSNQKSLRVPSSRKTGGQPGHEGTSLKMKDEPDETIEYRPDYCNQCGEALATDEATLISRKQEIEIPPIIPQYIEHRSYACTCKKCGFLTTSELPERLQANIQYSPNVSAWVAYLSVRQYLPYNRIAELMKDCFNLPLSEGTIDNMLKSITEKAKHIYQQIHRRIEQSPVVGGDETGVKINGKKGWLFTFQTPILTFLAVSLSRGYETIRTLFKNGFPMAVYVTDCLAAQLKTPARLHQICLAHLLRELNNFVAVFNCQWSAEMKQLLMSAIELKSQLQPLDYFQTPEKVMIMTGQLHNLLHTDLTDKNKKIKAFSKRLNKNNDAIFTFLYHQKVPPDNNASERAIRNAKVKMKVSNQFKVFEGARRFAVLRSVIDTTLKNSQNVLESLSCLANLAAE